MHRFASFLAAAALACSDPAVPADSGVDAGPICDELPPFETGSATGHAEPLGAGPGEVLAGVLSDTQLPPDVRRLATWAPGDFVLANERVALIIEGAGESDLYDPYGGRPVGIAQVEAGALTAPGDFNEVLLGWSGFLIRTDEVTVLNDGSDGEAAVVRATGTLGKLEFVGDLIEALIGTAEYPNVSGAMDYVMEPGSDSVDVYMSLAQPDPEGVRARFFVSAFFQHYRMPRWDAQSGFAEGASSTPQIAFIDDTGTSYAWSGPDGGELSRIAEISGVAIYTAGRPALPGCSVGRFHVGRMTLGGPGMSGLQEALARERGETLRTITGTVLEADGTPAQDVRVHVRRADGRHFARTTPEAGAFTIAAPDEAVTLWAYREGQALVGPVDVAADQATATIDLPAFATITVEVTDTARPAAPLPGRVQVIPTEALPALPADLGERAHGDGRSHVAFTTSGAIELRVDPGEHRVIVSRGYEYELHTETVNVAAGDAVTVTAALERSVDTTGVQCADYHIHTHRSPDSPDAPELKLRGLIADGLEIAIRSDHEWVNDFQPVIERLGLTQWAFGVGGEELTTFAWGHFGVFPLNEDESVNGSAVQWLGRLPPAVFDDARNRPERPALIINHPRSGGSFGGYFEAAGFDPGTGAIASPELWDEDFSLVEVFNDASLEESRTSTVQDWFALLNSGRHVFAVGSSDSHRIYGTPVGYPRTCLTLGEDDPSALDVNQVRYATNAGASVISGGLYLTVVGPNGVGPGEEATGVGDTALFDVTVQAASWIEGVDRLEVIVDGRSVETITITEADRGDGAIRLAATGISVPVAATGSWVVFHAATADTNDLSPVHPGRAAFAVSNPVFLSR
jgi:hypothetical protein